MLEGGVLPIEAATCLRSRDEQRYQDGTREGLVLADPLACVGLREDPGGRLVLQGRERIACVVTACQPLGARLYERADERPVLVERRPVRRRVLLECDRHVGALLELEP